MAISIAIKTALRKRDFLVMAFTHKCGLCNGLGGAGGRAHGFSLFPIG